LQNEAILGGWETVGLALLGVIPSKTNPFCGSACGIGTKGGLGRLVIEGRILSICSFVVRKNEPIFGVCCSVFAGLMAGFADVGKNGHLCISGLG
jgi:hypothetical protein